MNNKGFAISTILYSLLLMGTLIIFLLISNFSFERNTTSEFVNNIKNELNGDVVQINSPIVNAVDDDNNISGYLLDVTGEVIYSEEKVKIVTSLNDNYVINIDTSIQSGSNINLLINTEISNQEFKLIPDEDGIHYYIVPYENEALSFDIYDSSIANNANIQLFTKNNTTNQNFRFVESGEEGVYYIESALGTCVDLTDASVANNSNIASYSCNKSGAQKWKFIKT